MDKIPCPDTIRSAFCLIYNNQNKILLVQEGALPAKGKWCLPGGHCESGENIKNAAKREVYEETGGIVIEPGNLILQKKLSNEEYLGNPKDNGRLVEVNIFSGKILFGSINTHKLSDELDAKWFAVEEINKLPLRWKWIVEEVLLPLSHGTK